SWALSRATTSTRLLSRIAAMAAATTWAGEWAAALLETEVAAVSDLAVCYITLAELRSRAPVVGGGPAHARYRKAGAHRILGSCPWPSCRVWRSRKICRPDALSFPAMAVSAKPVITDCGPSVDQSVE